MIPTQISVLLGGLWSWDGPLFSSRGMYDLEKPLKSLSGFPIVEFTPWAKWEQVAYDMVLRGQQRPYREVVIGYSGGGSRATWLAEYCARTKTAIELMILYDPSPSWQMKPVGSNVRRVITYQNDKPFLKRYGCGVVTRPNDLPVERVPISEGHLSVQSDYMLHVRTVAAIGAMIDRASVKEAHHG